MIDWVPEYRKVGPEGKFGHYLIMAGALGGAACTAPGELFSEYEASVGTGQVHVWFDRPEQGFAAPHRTPTDPDYVRQNSGPDVPAAG